jgi:hypothetical protein
VDQFGGGDGQGNVTIDMEYHRFPLTGDRPIQDPLQSYEPVEGGELIEHNLGTDDLVGYIRRDVPTNIVRDIFYSPDEGFGEGRDFGRFFWENHAVHADIGSDLIAEIVTEGPNHVRVRYSGLRGYRASSGVGIGPNYSLFLAPQGKTTVPAPAPPPETVEVNHVRATTMVETEGWDVPPVVMDGVNVIRLETGETAKFDTDVPEPLWGQSGFWHAQYEVSSSYIGGYLDIGAVMINGQEVGAATRVPGAANSDQWRTVTVAGSHNSILSVPEGSLLEISCGPEPTWEIHIRSLTIFQRMAVA